MALVPPFFVALLAQIPTLQAPEPLPRAPLLERLLFEQPWGLIVGLLVVAVAAFVALNRRGLWRPGLMVLAGSVLVGAGAWVLATSVQTPREAMVAATLALVDATAAVDTRALSAQLAPDARLFSRFTQPSPAVPEAGLGKDEIIALVQRTLGDQWVLKEHSVEEVQAALDGPRRGRTQVRVRALARQWGVPYGSWWLINWRQEPDGAWRAVTIQPVAFPGLGER